MLHMSPMKGAAATRSFSDPLSGAPPSVEALTDENVDLKRKVDLLMRKLSDQKLQTKLLEGAKDSNKVVKCGYMYKYRPFSGGFFSPSWALRFFSLVNKNTLLYYRTEQDANNHPRGQIELSAAITVEVEGMKRGRYWTFALVDPTGGSLLRMSTQNKPDGELWVAFFKQAGCTIERLPVDRRHKSPRPPSHLRHRKPAKEGEETPSESEKETPSASEAESEAEDSQGKRRRPKAAPVERPDEKKRDWCASFPVHRSRYSILSSEQINTQTHHGLLNLGAVVLVTSQGRLIMENLLKYGFKAGQLRFWLAHPMRAVPLLLTWVGLSWFALVALAVERAGAKGLLKNHHVLWIHTLNTIGAVLVPCVIIVYWHPDLLVSLLFMLVVLTLGMKLVSYAHVNHDLRRLRREQPAPGTQHHGLLQQQLSAYPSNLTLGNMCYFLCAPTLCYQTDYPRSTRFRKRWFLRRCIELLVCMALMGILIEQYIYPACLHSLQPIQKGDILRTFERILAVAVPLLGFWLVMFYSTFHLWLNILAELLRFGDREFYRDWWNCTTIEQYWRLWNMPVHMWLVRHVYFPCMHYTRSKQLSVVVVFALSALFHELAVGVPMNLIRGWAFWGIMGQIPLIHLTAGLNKLLKNDQAGNIFFWLIFTTLGQPAGLLFYVSDYSMKKQLEG